MDKHEVATMNNFLAILSNQVATWISDEKEYKSLYTEMVINRVDFENLDHKVKRLNDALLREYGEFMNMTSHVEVNHDNRNISLMVSMPPMNDVVIPLTIDMTMRAGLLGDTTINVKSILTNAAANYCESQAEFDNLVGRNISHEQMVRQDYINNAKLGSIHQLITPKILSGTHVCLSIRSNDKGPGAYLCLRLDMNTPMRFPIGIMGRVPTTVALAEEMLDNFLSEDPLTEDELVLFCHEFFVEEVGLNKSTSRIATELEKIKDKLKETHTGGELKTGVVFSQKKWRRNICTRDGT